MSVKEECTQISTQKMSTIGGHLQSVYFKHISRQHEKQNTQRDMLITII